MAEMILTKRQTLLRSTSLVSFMTLLSRLVGFGRDMVIAYCFGTTAATDAFFVAFRIPNFMRRLFAEGAFSQAFVPVLAEYQKTATTVQVRLFLAKVSGCLGFVLFLVSAIGVLASPIVVYVFAPGFWDDPYRSVLATEMLRITFPYLMLISLTAMSGAVLNTYGYFGIPAFTPIFLNITMILAALYVSPHLHIPVYGLALGVLVAGFVQLFFQLPFLYQRGLLVWPKIGFHDPGVSRVMRLMVPALFGVSIAQLNLMVDTIFASFLKKGSVSWLYYTDRLTDFPLGVFGVAIATVILPHLSRRHAAGEVSRFSRSLDWGIRLQLLIGLPAGLGLAIFSAPMIAACFGYGAFHLPDILATQKSLVTLSLGIPAFMLVKVLASAFYAMQDIKTPVKIGAIAMVLNTILCAAFIHFLAHAGLTLASAIAGYFNAGGLIWILNRRGLYQPEAGWLRYGSQLLCANGVMGGYLYWVAGEATYWVQLPVASRLGTLLWYVFGAVIIYVMTLLISGVRLTQFRGQI